MAAGRLCIYYSSRRLAFWGNVLERVSRDPQWKESLEANHWQNDYRNSRDALRYLDALHVELRDVLKELGLAKSARLMQSALHSRWIPAFVIDQRGIAASAHALPQDLTSTEAKSSWHSFSR